MDVGHVGGRIADVDELVHAAGLCAHDLTGAGSGNVLVGDKVNMSLDISAVRQE
jgi:hypothetical protein